MSTLFRYELKKLFSRKIVWIAAALCLALMLWGNWSFISQKRSGEIVGIRDGYAAFEGRVVTDALVAEVKDALNEYIAAHPEDFESYDMGPDGGIVFFPVGPGYSSGVWQVAYNNISQIQTVEQLEETKALFTKYLANGVYDDGRPLTYSDQKYFENNLSAWEPAIVHYAEGWRQLTFYSQFCGYYLLILLLIGLSPLFTGESSSRMDSILLCSAHRTLAVSAKLASAALYALFCAVLIFGTQLLILTLTFGLEGASCPVSSMSGWMNSRAGETVGGAFLRMGILSLAADLALAVIVALASSLFHHPLLSLGSGMALIAVQYLPIVVTENQYLWHLDFMDAPFWYHAFNVLMLLPAIILSRLESFSYQIKEPYSFTVSLVLSLLLAAISVVLSYYYFLHRRKS